MLNKGMMARRFLNVVREQFGIGGSYYWVSRIKPEECLFHPSTAEALAAVRQAKKGKKNMVAPPWMESTLLLPAPEFRFQPSRSPGRSLVLVPFYGRGSSSESKILCTDSRGHTVLYDAGAGSVELMPCLKEYKGQRTVSLSVTHADAQDPRFPDALYLMNRFPSNRNRCNFEALIYSDPSDSRKVAENKAWHWHQLPPPPFLNDPDDDHAIKSYTLLEDRSTICVSSNPRTGFGTYCFDTASREWTKAGRWTLPFIGRAEHVPELHNLWFGIADNSPHNLCALDLSSLDRAPKLLHEWRDFDLPKDWLLFNCGLLYLGANRFCITKFFDIWEDREEGGDPIGMAAVLTGVEVLNGELYKTKLRMVKHKSKCYSFENDGIECVL